ncbi:hypothetical protein Golax_024306, partial [Gossypium laxum]|nr:hypothetical protein [Gossypium laxum]
AYGYPPGLIAWNKLYTTGYSSGLTYLDILSRATLPNILSSVANGRVLRDAISRRHRPKFPHDCYYLVDVGYTNCEGFLTPFRGQRYHSNEWHQAELGEGLPSNVIDDDEPNIVNIHPSDAWATWRMELANQMFYECFPYYDQLTVIYTKDQVTGKDAQTTANIIEEIDSKDVATANTHKEINDFHGCEPDVSLDEMDLSTTQPQPSKNQDDSTFSKKKKKKFLMQ